MNTMKVSSPVATLIGDVVSSRSAPDRPRLHAVLAAGLEVLNDEQGAPGDLRVTVGDELQGTFPDVGSAVRASWRLRWQLAGEAELRFGLGWGSITVLAEDPRVEDGPGWWAAREAIEAVKAEAERPGTRQLRTAYRLAEGATGPDPLAINAALMCRDHVVGSLSERSAHILGELIAGSSQVEIAERLGISPSAVSQRVRGDGLVVVESAQEMLEGVR